MQGSPRFPSYVIRMPDSPVEQRRPTPDGVPDRSLVATLRPVVAALVVALALFGAFALIQRLWLAGLPVDQLERIRRFRDLVAVLVAASLAGWLIMRLSPPLFLDDDAPARMPPASARKEERQVRYARWFILMRWVAVVAAAVLVYGAIGVMGYLPERLTVPLGLVIGALALMNVGYVVAFRSGMSSRTLLLVQAYGDLVVLTVLLHFSGGVENPLGTLMLFHVIIAGIVLSRRQCYLVAGVATALYVVMAWAEWGSVVDHYMLSVFPHQAGETGHYHAAHDTDFVVSRTGLQAAVLFLTAYFTTTITAQLRRGELKLERFADEVLAQRQLLERALDSTGSALRVCNRDLESTWTNPRWTEFFRETGDAAVQDSEELLRGTLEDGRTRVVEVDVPDTAGNDGADGARRTFLLTAAPLLDKDGEITHVVELAREMTELKRTRQRAARAEKLAAVGEFAGKVAHEVNNPNAIISGKVRLLLSDHADGLSPRAAEELDKIAELSDRVARIVQGLLSYTRRSHGTPGRVDIRAPVARAMALVERRASEADVELVQQLAADLPEAYVNAEEMERVFHNLFLNALDAMPDGGRLTVSAESPTDAPDATHLTVVVTDTGTGMPAELRERALEPFFTTKPEGRGTGLGLSVCIGLVRSNGGSMRLESEPGEGTRVVLTLPLHTARGETHG